MRSLKSVLLVLVALLMIPAVARGQATGLASLNGTVTDTTGATVPAAAIKLLNTRTGSSYSAETGADGGYRFVDVPPGPDYSLTVTKDSFQTFILNGMYLPVATATTKDVQLTLGAISQTIEVTASAGSVTLDTTDATIGNNFDMRAVTNLPNEYRDNPSQLLRLQVGVVSAETSGAAGNSSASNIDPNHTRDGSVAGARSDQNNIIVDGIDASDFAVGASFGLVAPVPVEAIQEFSTEVADPTPAFGGRSGATTLITTKSGTNTWHGSAYEYNRTAATEADTFFNQQSGVPREALERNQYGANIGGPALKDKLFFFFEWDARKDNSSAAVLQYVPFPHMALGELAYINNNSGCTSSARLTSADVSTNCVTILSAAQVAALDPCSASACATNAPGFVSAGAAPVLKNLFKNRYPAPNDYTVGDGINTAGFRFNAPNDLTERDFTTRVDYNINATNKIFGRLIYRNETAVENFNQFPGDPLTSPDLVRDRGWAIAETWTPSASLINQFTYGETRADSDQPILFNPQGSLFELSFFGSNGGTSFANPYVRQTQQSSVTPEPTFRDDVTVIRGKHTISFGGQFNPNKTRSSQDNDFTFIQEGLGGAISSLTPNLRPSNILGSNIATSEWDNFFIGDLGVINNVQTSVSYTHTGAVLPSGSEVGRDWRIYEIAGYVQDSWRLRNDFTVTAGVRYQFQSVPYEVHGNEATFLNTNTNDILSARIANGLNGIAGPGSTPEPEYQVAGKANGQPGLYQPEKHDFSPRLAFAWNPSFTDGFLGRAFGDRKTVFRAGSGMIYDESVINALIFIENQSNYLFGSDVSQVFNQGTGDTPTEALESDPRMNSITTVPFPVTPLPFTNPQTPTGIFNDGIDNQQRTPYSITASLGLQRQLPGGFQLELNYYGRFSRELLMLVDTAQTINFVDPASHESLVQAFTVLEQDSRLDGGAGLPASSVPIQPFLENQVGAALGGCPPPSCTAYVYSNNLQALQQGATGSVLENGILPVNVGLDSNWFVDALASNAGSSSYNAGFLTLRKTLSHNLQFDFNYTYSHSIDNGSTIDNENGNYENGVSSVLCDATNHHVCRGNSDFDATHQITGDFVYDLPFGRGQALGRNSGWLVNEAIGGWKISGIASWRTGLAQTVDNGIASTTSLAADAGDNFIGPRSALASNIHIDTANNDEVQFYSNPTAAIGAFTPVNGLESGTRNNLRGPHFTDFDASVSKVFPLWSERYDLKFVADAYNVFNHTNFGMPNPILTSGQFGVINGEVGQEQARVMQFALRFDF